MELHPYLCRTTGTFIRTTEQKHNCRSYLSKINPVARAVVNPEFADTISD